MRIRTIKPEFFTNEDIGSCSPLARLVAAGLPTHADREGRLEDRPKRLKVGLLPYDDCDFDALLGELESIGFIVRYEVEGLKLIQITNFLKHQRPNIKEPVSTFPHVQNNSGTATPTENDPVSIPVPLPILHSQDPDPDPDPDGPEFEEFYSAYPKHEAPKDARRAWAKLKPSRTLTARIMADFPARWAGVEPKYVPQPARYLNGRLWEGDLPSLARASPAHVDQLSPGMEKLKQIHGEFANGSTAGSRDTRDSQGHLDPPASRQIDRRTVG